MQDEILSDQDDPRPPKEIEIGMNAGVSIPSSQAAKLTYSRDFFKTKALSDHRN